MLNAVSRAGVADGAVVLPVSGRAIDRDLPYAGLTDLLSSTAAEGTADRLLDLVLTAGGHPDAPDARPLRLAVMEWLEMLADKRSVLVVADDAQWIWPTPVSSSASGYVAIVADRRP